VVADVLDGTLVAFCVRANPSVTPDDIRATCKKWLPVFMVPGDIVILDALPYLASAKVDRKALAAHYTNIKSAAKAQPASGPESETLRQISDLIGVVLNTQINDNTTLAAVGLDSLSAIRIASRLRKAGYHGIDGVTLLEAGTPAELASLIFTSEGSATRGGDDYSRPSQGSLYQAASTHELVLQYGEELEEVYLCTPIQAAMWAETAKDPQAYCNWVLLEAPTDDVTQVEQAMKKLTIQHPLLRSGFLRIDDTDPSPYIVVWKRVRPGSINIVQKLNFDFTLDDAKAALSPCSFQLLPGPKNVQVLLQIHHSLYDQWSIDVLKADLAALLRGQSVDDRPSFASLCGWQADHRKTPSTEAIDFWTEHLQGFTATPVPNLRGEVVPRGLERTRWHDLQFGLTEIRTTTIQQGLSVPAVFQAALVWIWASYSGSPDVVLGTVLSGRHLPIDDIEHMFGPCLCALPIRVDLSSVQTCLDLVRLVHHRNRAMQRHAHLPLADIKRASGCASDVALFDTLFIWQESTIKQDDNAGAVVEIDSADHHEFNLVLEVQPSASGAEIRATYQQHLLPGPQVELLLRQLGCITQAIMSQLEKPTASLYAGLEPDLVSASNTNPVPSAKGNDVVEAIETQAIQRPDATALLFALEIGTEVDKMTSVTYSELNAMSNRVAHLLQSFDVLPDDLVCICMEKSVELYASIVAALKAGAGYLPLTPDTPRARMQNILRQAGAKVVLCDATSVAMLTDLSDLRLIHVDKTDLSGQSEGNLQMQSQGSHVAYTVYTSGSTGEPKGVVVTRDNLAGNLAVLSELYRVKPADRLLQACSQAFDVSVFEIFFAFSTGMCLCSAVKDTLFQDLELSIRQFGATHLSLTPTVAALIDPSNVPSVGFLVTAGEGVTEAVRRKWAGKGLHQGYGPSETTNICTINMNMRPDDVLGNIGPPFANTSAFVIAADAEDFRILPAGAVGEFAFGGEQVFRGYLGRDDLNAKKLFQHPKYGLLYRSGDVGRIMHNGSLLTVGRLDDQVKIRGNRVELGEITSVLLQDSEVADCAALVEGADSSSQSLVAFWVPQWASASNAVEAIGCDSGTLERLFSCLESSLPSYMVPEVLIPITKMPLTTQGKLDKRLLRALLRELGDRKGPLSGHSATSDSDAQWSEMEIQVTDVLSQTLKIPRDSIGRTTSFFALGMNSLSAIAFARAAANHLHQPITMGLVLRNPSIARLVMHLSRACPNSYTAPNNDAKLPLIDADIENAVLADCKARGILVEKILPCTPLQEAMLSATALSGPSAYSNSTVFAVRGDLARLKLAWVELVHRHDILRSLFVSTDSAAHPFAQVVMPRKELPWPVQAEKQERKAIASVSHSIGLRDPWYIEAHTNGDHSVLTVRMHHAVYDGISMSILLDEAERLYRGENLPDAPSYEAFLAQVAAQRDQATLAFCSNRLRNYQPKPFPLDHSQTSSHAGVLRSSLSPAVSQLDAFCKKHNVTPLIVLQAAWAKTLACAQEADDICFGNVVSGRDVPVPDIERLVAPCFNTTPVRVNIARHQSNDQLMRHLRSWNVETLEHQLAPLRSLQAMTRSPHQHLFDSLLLLQPPKTSLDSQIWSIERDDGSMDVALVLEVVPEEGKYTLLLHHLLSAVSRELAPSIARTFDAALGSILQWPAAAVNSFGDHNAGIIGGKLKSPTIEDSDSPSSRGTAEMSSRDHAWTPTESMVRKVFADLSKVQPDRIGRNTSMYQLGLDSLNAAQIAARLRSEGLHLDATDMMESLTPADIAAKATAQQNPAGNDGEGFDLDEFDKLHRNRVMQKLSLGEEALQTVRPCTAVQSGMIAQSLHSGGKLYINHITYEVPKDITMDDIEQSWQAVLVRHPALRLGIVATEDAQNPFLMAILRPDHANVVMDDCGADMEQSNLEDRAARDILASKEQRLWQISIMQQDGRMLMTLSIHHACYDAESLRYLLDDFAQVMSTGSLGTPLNFDGLLSPALIGTSNGLDASEKFWKEALKEAMSVFPFECCVIF
jgi:ferricrocin synthase